MTAAPREKLTDRFMEAVFGKRGTPEEIAFAEQTKPPKALGTALFVIRIIMVLLMVVTLLWSDGWLPFVDSKIDRSWFYGVWALVLLLQLLSGWINKHYEKRAAARLASAR